ncbi:MAG: glutaredoxin family protein [Olleya sp.]
MKPITLSLFLICILLSCNPFQSNNSKDAAKAETNNVIIVYGSYTCHYCIDTKSFLEEHKIPFKFFDIDNNEVALQEMLNKLRKANIDVSDLKIPVIDKHGEVFTNNIKFEDFLNKLKS